MQFFAALNVIDQLEIARFHRLRKFQVAQCVFQFWGTALQSRSALEACRSRP
jgi:hypothetical protein